MTAWLVNALASLGTIALWAGACLAMGAALYGFIFLICRERRRPAPLRDGEATGDCFPHVPMFFRHEGMTTDERA